MLMFLLTLILWLGGVVLTMISLIILAGLAWLTFFDKPQPGVGLNEWLIGAAMLAMGVMALLVASQIG